MARLYAATIPRGLSWGLSHCCCLDMLPFKRTAFGKHIKQQLSINATRSSTHPSSQHTNATRSWERRGNCRREPRPTLPSWHMARFQWSTQEAGSPEDSERDTSYSGPQAAGLLGLNTCPPGWWCPQVLPVHVEVAGWGLINLVTHDGINICRGAQNEGETSFRPGLN